MNIHLLLFSVDVVAILTMAVIGVNFLMSDPKSRNAQLWAFIGFNSVCYLLFSRYIISDLVPAPYQIDLGPYVFVVRMAMNLTPGLFMILAHSLFHDGRKFPVLLLLAFLVQILLEEPIPFLFSINVAQGDLLFEATPAILQVFFVCMALYWTLSNWRADLVEERRVLRFAFLSVAGIYIIASVVFGRVLIANDILSPLASHAVLNALCALIGLSAIFAAFQGNIRIFIEPGKVTVAPPVDTQETGAADDVRRITAALETDKVYREGGLTVGSLAAKLSLPEYRLRKLIHEQLGYRNFNALLHHYRVEEAAERLARDCERNIPILTIALSVGYQSISPFNRAFREQKGLSPSEFRANCSQKTK